MPEQGDRREPVQRRVGTVGFWPVERSDFRAASQVVAAMHELILFCWGILYKRCFDLQLSAHKSDPSPILRSVMKRIHVSDAVIRKNRTCEIGFTSLHDSTCLTNA